MKEEVLYGTEWTGLEEIRGWRVQSEEKRATTGAGRDEIYGRQRLREESQFAESTQHSAHPDRP